RRPAAATSARPSPSAGAEVTGSPSLVQIHCTPESARAGAGGQTGTSSVPGQRPAVRPRRIMIRPPRGVPDGTGMGGTVLLYAAGRGTATGRRNLWRTGPAVPTMDGSR